MAGRKYELSPSTIKHFAAGRLTVAQIAQRLGCSPPTVRNLLMDAGVYTPRRAATAPTPKPRFELLPSTVARFRRKEVSVAQLARDLQCHPETVRNHLKRAEAGLRPGGRQRIELPGWALGAYAAGMSMTAIAELVGCARSTVKLRLAEADVECRSANEQGVLSRRRNRAADTAQPPPRLPARKVGLQGHQLVQVEQDAPGRAMVDQELVADQPAYGSG